MPAFYTNITQPTLPTWDTAAHPYYLVSFIYDERQNDWSRVRLTYASQPFEHKNGTITNPGTCYFKEYTDGSWDNYIVTIDAGEMAYPVGKIGGVFQRYWTSHDIPGLMAAGGRTPGAWLMNHKDFWHGVAMGLKSKGLPANSYRYNGANYLTFASADPFTIGVYNAKKNWDGILEYSTDLANWNEWDGTNTIASAEHDGEQRIYMRGSGNTVITGNSWSVTSYDTKKYNFVLSGSNIRCEGNIENLLDYETVANGEHPDMGNYCFASLFYDCRELITAPKLPSIKLTYGCYGGMFSTCIKLTASPELPATELATDCYRDMFRYCNGLTVAPKLPATILAKGCYARMFEGSDGLKIVPSLPATELAYGCYNKMFQGCDGLTTIPALPATALPDYCYDSMFYNASVKLSKTQSNDYPNEYRIPASGDGTKEFQSLVNMFMMTDGSFTGTPSINTTYYTANEVIYPPEAPEPSEHTDTLIGYLAGNRLKAQR